MLSGPVRPTITYVSHTSSKTKMTKSSQALPYIYVWPIPLQCWLKAPLNALQHSGAFLWSVKGGSGPIRTALLGF